MSLRSLTYVSRAVLPFSDDEFQRLGLEAARLNALDGITGLLVFNGTRFCQTIEGSPEAIENLLARLRRDCRHEKVTVTDDAPVEERRFRSWDMQFLSVSADRDEALAVARTRLDPADLAARGLIYQTVEGAFG